MTGVLLASAILVSGYLEPQIAAPSGLQTEQAVNPTAVTDNRPDFRAVNESAVQMERFQIQVSTDPTFITVTHWNSNANGSFFIGSPPLLVPKNSFCPEIPYGYGEPDLLAIPMLNWNTTYYWRTRFWRLSAATDISPTAQFTMAAPSRALSQHQNNGSSSVEGWRFVSVPIAFGTTVPASELLASVAFLYQYDEPGRMWRLMGPGDLLYGGKGYLAWAPPGAVLSLTTPQAKVTHGVTAVLSGTGATITPSYTLPNASFVSAHFSYTSLAAPIGQEITDAVGANGYAGNHLFGNPYNAPISWKDHTSGSAPFGHVSRTNISALMYKWNGTQYLTYNGATGAGTAGEWIEPFQAVGILVLSTAPWQLTVNTPAPTSGGPQERMAPSRELGAANPNRWYLMVEARSGAAIDTENAFGIDTDADDAWDIRDSEDPGVGTTTWLNVHFDHRTDWTTYAKKYTHDFRKTPLKKGDVVTWTFTVDGNTGLPATLTWPNLADLSADDWKLTLEDPAGPTVVNLSTTSSYDTAPVNGPSTLTLRATRLKDAPVSSESGGGSNCGLLGLEGLLLAGWTLLRRGCKLAKTA